MLRDLKNETFVKSDNLFILIESFLKRLPVEFLEATSLPRQIVSQEIGSKEGCNCQCNINSLNNIDDCLVDTENMLSIILTYLIKKYNLQTIRGKKNHSKTNHKHFNFERKMSFEFTNRKYY